MRPVLMPLASALVVAVSLLTIRPCSAQSRAYVTTFDPSIESAGMGGATVAAFWLDTPNVWINPALAGFQRGLTYSFGSTQLAPGVSNDVGIESHRILVGVRGIGVEISGKPLHALGKTRLDYGEVDYTDFSGNQLEAYPYEELRSLGVGVDFVVLLTSFREPSSEQASIRRRFSLALGHTWKDLVADLGPFSPFSPTGEAKRRDLGALLRVAPLDQIGETSAGSGTRWRVEVAAGYSDQGYDMRAGGEIRTAADLTQYGSSVLVTAAPTMSPEGRIWDLATPEIALGLTWTSTDQPGPTTNRFGAELSLFNVLYLRGGFVDDDSGDIHSGTWGGGVRLAYREAIGVRFDYAKYPQHEDLHEDLDRIGAAAFLDPYRLWREMW